MPLFTEEYFFKKCLTSRSEKLWFPWCKAMVFFTSLDFTEVVNFLWQIHFKLKTHGFRSFPRIVSTKWQKSAPKNNVKGISIIEVRQFDVGAFHQPIQQLHLCFVTIMWNSQSDIMRIEYWSWELVFKTKLPLIHLVFAWNLTH